MKIAITSDVHLAPDHPERLQNLETIIKYLYKSGIRRMILAGDLFDRGFDGYKEMDRMVFQYPDMIFHLIPGNHDQDISQRFFGSGNIRVHGEPEILIFETVQFVFLPFRDGDTMGGIIEKSELAGRLEEGRWVLVSHGDFGGKNKAESGNEEGYFPLTKRDIILYAPALAILGHIHKHHRPDNRVVYPGSPYPLDITETGQRGLIIYDTATATAHRVTIPFAPVYLIADIFIVPDGNEAMQIRRKLEYIIEEEGKKYEGDNYPRNLTMRVMVRGYTTTREGIEGTVRELLGSRGIGIESVTIEAGISSEQSLNDIARRVSEKIDGLYLAYPESGDVKGAAVMEAYRMIYRGEGS